MKFISSNTSKGGHYSSGVLSRGTLYISGQLPIDPKTGKIAEGSVAEQTRTALGNIERILHTATSRISLFGTRRMLPTLNSSARTSLPV